MYAQNVISAFRPNQHRIQQCGLGYSRPLDNDELAKMAPAIFADSAHPSRSQRYAYISTQQLLDGMRSEGFMPVRVTQAKARDDDRLGHCKHMIRFRRHDQLESAEAREVVLVNSHDGTSGFKLMAGVYRLVCANGLVVGNSDNEISVRHSGHALDNVIEGAYTIVKDFDRVDSQIDGMKALTLTPEQKGAFAKAALALRFQDPSNCGIDASRVIVPKRRADTGSDLWTTFNVAQENIIRGGLHGRKIDGNGRMRRVSTRQVNGIDQNVALNRGLWTLAEEMKKLLA